MAFKKAALRVIAISLLVGAFALAWYFSGREEPKPEELTVQLNWFAGGEHAYWYYGESLGIFESANVSIVPRGGRGSELSARLLAAGDVDLSLVGPDAILASREQGADLISLGVIYDHTPVSIYSIAEPGLKDFTDLYGKTLGVLLGSNTYVQYEGVARMLDLDRDKIKERQVDGAAAPALLLEGALDALMYYTHHAPVKARQLGYPVTELALREYIDMYGMTVASRPRLKEKVEVSAIIEAIKDSLLATRENPSEAIDAMAKKVDVADRDYELGKLERFLAMVFESVPQDRSLLSQSRQRWLATANALIDLGVISSTAPAEGVIYGRNESKE